MNEPVIGFRAWILQYEPELQLKAVAMNYLWPVGTAEASCMTGPKTEPPKHPAPADGCRCGLHARTTLAGVLEEYPYYPVHGYWGYAMHANPNRNFMVMGAVLMWGDIHRGDKVIRASHSRVLCLTDKDNPWVERQGSINPAGIAQDRRDERAKAIESICQAYGIPMVPYDTCEMYASEFGEYCGPRRSED